MALSPKQVELETNHLTCLVQINNLADRMQVEMMDFVQGIHGAGLEQELKTQETRMEPNLIGRNHLIQEVL